MDNPPDILQGEEPYPVNEQGHRICGAVLKGGTRICQSTAVMENGRCKWHGGKSLRGVDAPRFKHGRYSKVLPKNLLDDYMTQRTDGDLLTLREEIALVDALIMDRLRNLGNGQTDDLWKQLRDTYEHARKAASFGERARMRRHFEELRELIEDGASDSMERQELLDLLERRRRMVETERRLLVEMGLMMSANDLMAAVAVIVSIIEEHVEDREVRARIGNDIHRLVVARNSRASFAQVLGLDPTRSLSGA